MMRFLVALVCVFGASVALAADLTLAELDRRFAEVGARERVETLAMLDGLIDQAGSKIAAAKKNPQLSPEDRAAAVKDLRDEIERREAVRDRINQSDYVFPSLPIAELAVGQIGCIIIDEDEPDTIYARVTKIIDKRNALARIEGTNVVLWRDGDDAKVGARYHLDGVAIVGTRQLNGQTHFVFRAYQPPQDRVKKR